MKQEHTRRLIISNEKYIYPTTMYVIRKSTVNDGYIMSEYDDGINNKYAYDDDDTCIWKWIKKFE
jgi:hypothetical protein